MPDLANRLRDEEVAELARDAARRPSFGHIQELAHRERRHQARLRLVGAGAALAVGVLLFTLFPPGDASTTRVIPLNQPESRMGLGQMRHGEPGWTSPCSQSLPRVIANIQSAQSPKVKPSLVGLRADLAEARPQVSPDRQWVAERSYRKCLEESGVDPDRAMRTFERQGEAVVVKAQRLEDLAEGLGANQRRKHLMPIIVEAQRSVLELVEPESFAGSEADPRTRQVG